MAHNQTLIGTACFASILGYFLKPAGGQNNHPTTSLKNTRPIPPKHLNLTLSLHICDGYTAAAPPTISDNSLVIAA